MPGINDPGNSLLNIVSLTNHTIKIIPQTSAVISAYLLSGSSGNNGSSFFFGGMIDHYSNVNDRQKLIKTAKNNTELISIYLVSNFASENIKETIKEIYPNRYRVSLCMDIGMDTQKIIRTDTVEMFDIARMYHHRFITIVVTP